MNFFSAYDSRTGFRFTFELLYNVPVKDSIYQGLVSLCPPAAPYTSEQTMKSAFKLYKVDWAQSLPNYFLFDEDEILMKNQKLDNSSCMIIDLKRYNFVKKETSDLGFAVLPLVQEF